jgi:hypothetical protein
MLQQLHHWGRQAGGLVDKKREKRGSGAENHEMPMAGASVTGDW